MNSCWKAAGCFEDVTWVAGFVGIVVVASVGRYLLFLATSAPCVVRELESSHDHGTVGP